MNYFLKNSKKIKFKEKRSEFVTHSVSIYSVDELNTYLKQFKSEYPTARHFCWAYRITENDDIIENSSDAGEPSGSAGLPILNVLKSENLVNCGIVVIRFFGGVKLGKQGLINAYKTASEMVIAKSDIAKWIPISSYLLTADMKYFGLITHCIQQFNGKILNDYSGEIFKIVIEIQNRNFKDFSKSFSEMTQNSGEIKKQSEHDQTKEVRK